MNGDTTNVLPLDDMEILKELMAKPITTVLTLRDHFALAALAALLHPPRPIRLTTSHDPEWFADMAYAFADAMVKARGAGT